MTAAILAAAALLAVGLTLRTRLRWLRRLHVPAAAVGGVVGAVVIQVLQRSHPWPSAPSWANAVAAAWTTWPGTLVAVVFAGMLLERPRPGGLGSALRRGTQSAALAWVIILGQLVIGLLVYLIAVRPARPDVPATFGQLLEVSWAGGPGSAAAMGQVYAGQGFPAGRDLAFFLSTVGLIYGVVSGLAFVNVAIRRGWTAAPADADDGPSVLNDSDGPRDADRFADAIEPLAVQVVILAAAYGAGLLLQRLFVLAAGLVLAGGPARDAAGNVPLFLFALLGGWWVRRAMTALGIARLIDVPSLQRLTGVAMEFLIVAGVASIRVDALGSFVGPVSLLLAGAAAWAAFCLFVLSRRLLPAAYWFELGLLNYGFSTANTPQGLMLLRIIDPELRSGAAADYAIAAPLSAPFVGGGVVTFVVLPVALQRLAPFTVLAILLAVLVAVYAVAARSAGRRPVSPRGFEVMPPTPPP